MSRAETGPELRKRLLGALYPDAFEEVAHRLEAMLDGARSRRPLAGPDRARADNGAISPRWSEDDVWLITYADQFVHPVGSPLATLDRVVSEALDDVCTGVHILPFYPSSSDDGFAVMDYRAVDPAHGDWSDVRRLADRKRLMFDAVINHASARGQWFERFLASEEPFDRFFRTEDPEADLRRVVRARTHPLLTRVTTSTGERWVWTTFSADQVDLDYAEPAVLLEIVEVLLYYVEQGASAIRLDAIGFLWKDPARSSIHLAETHSVIRLLRSCLDELESETIVISETNVPHVENVSYFNEDPPEVHAVYQFPLAPLLAHSALTGDVSALVEWCQDIDELVDDDQTFLTFLASHDGIGVRPAEGLLSSSEVGALVAACLRVGGEVSYRESVTGDQTPYELNTTWFDLLSDGVDEATAIARHLATHAVMLALPGIAAVYVHSFFGSSNDRRGFERTGRARSLNRERFTDVDAMLTDLVPGTGSRSARVLEGMRQLVERRRSSPAFNPGGRCSVTSPGPGVIDIERRYGEHRGRCVVNLGRGTTDLEIGPWESLDGDPCPSALGPGDVRWLVPRIQG